MLYQFILVCLLVFTCHAGVSSPCNTEAVLLAECGVSRTALLDLYYSKFPTVNQTTTCIDRNYVSSSYATVLPTYMQDILGYRYDMSVFRLCDGVNNIDGEEVRDGIICPEYIYDNDCTCVTTCWSLTAVQVILDSMTAYPDWATAGVPYNFNQVRLV